MTFPLFRASLRTAKAKNTQKKRVHLLELYREISNHILDIILRHSNFSGDDLLRGKWGKIDRRWLWSGRDELLFGVDKF